MKPRRFLSIALLVATAIGASARQHTYEIGTLTEVSDKKVDTGSAAGFPLYAHLYYILEIHSNGVLYGVLIDKQPYVLEWSVGSSIQFRTDGPSTIYLRRPNGKELRANLVKAVPATDAPPKPSAASGIQPRDASSVPNGAIFMGIDVIQGGNRCMILLPNILPSPWYSSERQFNKRTSPGRNSGSFEDQLQDTNVLLLIGVQRCDGNDPDHTSQSLQPEFQFDQRFIESLQFEAFWKDGFQMDPADVGVGTMAEVTLPDPMRTGTKWYEYRLQVARAHSPNKRLVLNVVSHNGKLISRFSAKPAYH